MDTPLRRTVRLLLDAVAPRDCLACDAPLPPGHADAVCAACVETMHAPRAPLCPRCGIPLAAGRACPDCVRLPPAFRMARAAAVYRPSDAGLNPLARAVHGLKYAGRRPLAAALGRLLVERWPYADDVVLVPVPLHPARLRARGYNQAALLARVVARRRRLPLDVHALRRTRDTANQPGLGAVARRTNLADAFAVPRPSRVVGRTIVLVDDVLTTGATADACARALCAAGAAAVDVWAVGRVP